MHLRSLAVAGFTPIPAFLFGWIMNYKILYVLGVFNMALLGICAIVGLEVVKHLNKELLDVIASSEVKVNIAHDSLDDRDYLCFRLDADGDGTVAYRISPSDTYAQ